MPRKSEKAIETKGLETKNYLQKIKNSFAAKNYKWLITFFFLPLLLVVFLLFQVTDYSLGLTKEGARNKLDRENVLVSDKNALRYSVLGEKETVVLLERAGADKSYILAGSLISNNPLTENLLKSYLDKDTNLTANVEKFGDYLGKIEFGDEVKKNLNYNTSCTSLLGLAVGAGQKEKLITLISNGKIEDKQDCSLRLALNKGDTSLIEILTNNARLDLRETDLISFVSSGQKTVIPFLTQENVSEKVLQAALNMSHDSHDSKDHDNHESQMVEAVFKFASQERKDKELISSLENRKINIAASLIRLGAKSDLKFTPKNSSYYSSKEVETTPFEYAVSKKEDALLSALIDAGYKYPETVTVQNPDSFFGQDKIRENLLYYTISNKMVRSSNNLIDKGFDVNSSYLPSVKSAQGYPLVFAAASSSSTFGIIPKMVEKGDVINRLSQEKKQEFLAYFLYNFADTPIMEDLEIVKFVLKQDLDINSTLNYNGGYSNFSAPVWSSPLYRLTGGSTEKSVREVIGEYIKLIKDKALKVDFTRDRKTSIGIATHLGQTELVRLMLDKGIDPNSLDSSDNQESILNIALKKGYKEIVQALVEKKVDLNKESRANSIFSASMTTPLLSVLNTQNGYGSQDEEILDNVKLLVENGADVNKCVKSNDKEQECPLSVASYYNSKGKIVEYLKSKGAKCDFVSSKLCKI
jgi:Ankyrin repeats (3 copies)